MENFAAKLNANILTLLSEMVLFGIVLFIMILFRLGEGLKSELKLGDIKT